MQNNGIQNLVRFFLVAAVLYFAWSYLYPPKPKSEEPESPKLPSITREQAAAVASPIILAGEPFSNLSPGRPPKSADPKPVVKVPATPAEPPTLIALGDDTFALKALLTNKGAGVQQLILTKYLEADRMGRPVKGDDPTTKRPLYLIPGFVRPIYLYLAEETDYPTLAPNLSATDLAAGKKPGVPGNSDQLAAPSYTLLHYPAKDDPLRPLDKDGKTKPEDDRIPLPTLGEQNWKVVSIKQPSDAPWEVVFETELAAPYHLKLRKTFSLDRTDYDFKLKVEIVPQ